jgi:hypothetical protein
LVDRRYLPVKAAALAAAGFLLTGGVAVAAPDSHSDKGGGNGSGKPSAAASGGSAGNSGSAPGNSGSAPGKSGSAPGNSGSAPGNSGSGPKTLPGAASPVAGGATGKDKPTSTGGAPNSFGKSVAAAVSSQLGQGNGKSIEAETPSATTAPTATASVSITVPIPDIIPATVIPTNVPVTIPSSVTITAALTAAPSAPARDSDSAPAPARADRNRAILTTPPTAPSVTVTPGVSGAGAQQAAALPPAAPASAAAVSISPPQSTGGTAGPSAGPSPMGGTETSWIGRVASQVADEVREALREVTLKELALAAFPGLVGMLFFFTTGIGLGHRQAKFGFALESTGALRFAARGPLGVVRPGGFIAMPTRAGKARSSVPRRSDAALLGRAA